MEGLPTQIAQYVISEATKDEKTEKCSFTMRVSNNIHNVACLDEVEFVQEWNEEEKIAIKASPVTTTPPPKKEGEKGASAEKTAEAAKGDAKQPEATAPAQQYETKIRAKKSFGKIKFSSSSYALSPQLRKQYKEKEDELLGKDNDILEMKMLRNTLEAYSYEMRANLDSYGAFEKYLEDSQRKAFLAQIGVVVEWLYADGETAPKPEYEKRIADFKAIGEPVKARHFYYGELELYYAQFDKVMASIKDRLATLPELTETQKETITKKADIGQAFIDGVKADR